MRTNGVTDILTSYSKENLDATDFNVMLEGFGVSEKVSNKLKEECGSWNLFLRESIEELTETFTKLNLNKKTTCSLPSIKCKVIFDHLDMHDIANMKMSIKEQIEHINSVENGGYAMPSFRRAFYTEDKIQNFCGSNTKHFIKEEDYIEEEVEDKEDNFKEEEEEEKENNFNEEEEEDAEEFFIEEEEGDKEENFMKKEIEDKEEDSKEKEEEDKEEEHVNENSGSIADCPNNNNYDNDYNLTPISKNEHVNDNENVMEKFFTQIFHCKTCTYDSSKSITYSTIDHEQCKEQQHRRQQCHYDEEEKKNDYHPKTEGNHHCNRIVNIAVTSTTTYLGK